MSSLTSTILYIRLTHCQYCTVCKFTHLSHFFSINSLHNYFYTHSSRVDTENVIELQNAENHLSNFNRTSITSSSNCKLKFPTVDKLVVCFSFPNFAIGHVSIYFLAFIYNTFHNSCFTILANRFVDYNYCINHS